MTPPRPRRADAVLGAIVVVVGLVVALLIARVQTNDVSGLLDLRIYLGASGAMRSGGSPYDFHDAVYGLGSTYPPIASLLFLPLTFVDVHVVEQVFVVGNALLWLVTLRMLWSRLPAVRSAGPEGGRWSVPLPVATVWLLSLPSVGVWNSLNQGQVNIVLWFLIAFDLMLVAHGDRRAGLATGVAAAIKIHPVAILVVVGLAGVRSSGSWGPSLRRAALRGLMACAVLTAAGALVRWDDSVRFWTGLVWDPSRIGDVADAQNNSLRAVLAHLPLPAGVGTALWLAAGGVLLALTIRALRRALAHKAVVTAATVAGCFTALVSPIAWMHHLVFLTFPVLLAVPVASERGRRPAWGWALVVVLSVALADPLGSNGRSLWTSAARTLAMVALIAFAPMLVDRERAVPTAGGGASPAPPAGPGRTTDQDRS